MEYSASKRAHLYPAATKAQGPLWKKGQKDWKAESKHATQHTLVTSLVLVYSFLWGPFGDSFLKRVQSCYGIQNCNGFNSDSAD